MICRVGFGGYRVQVLEYKVLVWGLGYSRFKIWGLGFKVLV